MLQQQWKILLHHFYRFMFLNLILMLDSLPGVWWSSSSRNGVCRPSSACQPSAACKRSTMSTSLCKCSKAKGSTSRMNAVIVIFFFFFSLRANDKTRWRSTCESVCPPPNEILFSVCSVQCFLSQKCYTFIVFSYWAVFSTTVPLHLSMNACLFTAHLLCWITNGCKAT